MITVLNNSKTDKIEHRMPGMKTLLIGILAAIVISIVLLASVPPVSRDALIHHLALPKLYLKYGGIYEIPAAEFSYYPMNLDLLYMVPLYFGNDIVPKYLHFAFAVLTAIFIFRYLRRRLDDAYALLGAILFLSIPVIVKLSITVYVDLGLIFFSTAALFCLIKWMNDNYKFKHLFISAVWCGLGLGTKYNGLIVLFLITLFVVLIFARSSKDIVNKQTKALGYGIAFMLVAVIVFSPWAIKNYIWTRNPVYPLYDSWFNNLQTQAGNPAMLKNSGGRFENAKEDEHLDDVDWGSFRIRNIVFKETWWQIALIPIRVFFQGADDNPKYFDGKLNPLLFFLPILAFLRIKKDSFEIRNEKIVLLAFSILFILYTFFQTDMRIRYIGPVIPPLVVLAMFGLSDIIHIFRNRFSGNSKKIGLAGIFLGVSILFCLNVLYVIDQFRHVSPLKFISGRVGREAYIERYRPDYAAIRFANMEVPDNGVILGVFLGNRRYYSDRQMVFNFKKFLLDTHKQNLSTKEVTASLNDAGITHLIIRFDLFNQWVDNNFDEHQKRKLAHLFKTHMDLVFSKGGHGVFKLRAI